MAEAHDVWLAGLGVPIAKLQQAAGAPTKGGSGPGGPAAGTAAAGADAGGNDARSVGQRILGKITQDADLSADVAMLERMEMRPLLEVVAQLKQAGKLEDFAGFVRSENRRVGVAILTLRPDLDLQWQGLVARLGDDDRRAVLERVPEDARAGLRGSPSGSAPAPAADGEPAVDADAAIAVGPDGVEVQATLTFHSSLTGNLGETAFTVHIGPDGRLSQFELDVTAIKAKIEQMGALSSMLELEATLSLNATTDISQQATQTIFNAVQVQAKGEIEAHFRTIEALRKVAFKLTATAGSGGFSVTGSIEIAIPGT